MSHSLQKTTCLSARVPSGADQFVQPPFRFGSFRETVGLSAPDTLSVLLRTKKSRVPGKRIHLVRNLLLCDRCWRTEEGIESKRLFNQSKGAKSDAPVQHAGCGGHFVRYYELSPEKIVQFVKEKLFLDVQYRNFFPVMGDLVRPESQDNQHHNASCTGTCCIFPQAGSQSISLGPEPSAQVDVRVVLSYATFYGWEEQCAKTCAAASVAGALNALFHKERRSKSSDDDTAAEDSSSRVSEKDVLDYYCKWAKDAGKISCVAALRGSCGLTPSTRKIGNPRLISSCHAVSKAFFRPRRGNEEGSGAPPSAANTPGDERGESIFDLLADLPSPIETERMMGNWQCREAIAEGGRCGPDDDADVEVAQWDNLCSQLTQGNAILVHSRNHYSLVFGAREWVCESSGAVRRQILTATTKQRPHVWFCFSQLRADIMYSKVNQVILLKKVPNRDVEFVRPPPAFMPSSLLLPQLNSKPRGLVLGDVERRTPPDSTTIPTRKSVEFYRSQSTHRSIVDEPRASAQDGIAIPPVIIRARADTDKTHTLKRLYPPLNPMLLRASSEMAQRKLLTPKAIGIVMIRSKEGPRDSSRAGSVTSVCGGSIPTSAELKLCQRRLGIACA